MLRLFGYLTVAFATLQVHAQQIDWANFFRDLVSRDHAVQNAALEKMANDILPKLCSGKAELIAPEIPGLIKEMEDSNPEVRVETSAFLFTMARFRPDSEIVLAAAIPVFMDHAQHDTESQTRRNCANALAELKPEVPAQALPLMLQLADGNDAAVQPGAIWGLARVANSHPQAAQALGEILTQNDSATKKKLAIGAIGANHLSDTRLIAALGGFLSDNNPDLQRTALLAINRCGGRAVAVNREQLARFAETSTNKDLAALARRLLDRSEQK
jgi:HEAT repeat protein